MGAAFNRHKRQVLIALASDVAPFLSRYLGGSSADATRALESPDHIRGSRALRCGAFCHFEFPGTPYAALSLRLVLVMYCYGPGGAGYASELFIRLFAFLAKFLLDELTEWFDS